MACWFTKGRTIHIDINRRTGAISGQIAFHRELPGEIRELAKKYKKRVYISENEVGEVYYRIRFGRQRFAALSSRKRFKFLRGQGLPQPINHYRIQNIMRTEGDRVMIYTGAGISADRIPDMETFKKRIGMDNNNVVDELARRFVHSPDRIKEVYRRWIEAFKAAEPSEVHHSLKRVTEKYGCGMITENVDDLHEKAGSESILKYQDIQPGNKRREGIIERAKNLKYIITMGLSMDKSGLLYAIRQVNPRIKIIAMCNEKPEYIGENDFFCECDLRQAVPKLLDEY